MYVVRALAIKGLRNNNIGKRKQNYNEKDPSHLGVQYAELKHSIHATFLLFHSISSK